MNLPPRWVRRTVLAPAMIVVTMVVLTTLPVWLLLAAALSPLLPGRWRALRVLWVGVVALVLECVLLVALFGLWLIAGFGAALRTPRIQYLHYQLAAWYLRVLYREAARALRLRVEVEGPSPDDYLDRPLLVFCRHAGPGDSFLLIHALTNWYAREPRIVLTEAMQWDPALDVLFNRLPTTFVPGDAFVLFPEGGNFTRRRRLAGIERLRAKGLEEMARRSEEMRHVLPPRPGGVAAALAAAPGADVVWVAHAGLDHLFTLADVWRELPLDGIVRMRWWQVPAAEVPHGEEAQVEWLYTWWERIDDWVDGIRAAR